MARLTYHFGAPEEIPLTAEWLDQRSGETTHLLGLLDGDPQTLRTNLPVLKSDFRLVCLGVKAIIVQSNRADPIWPGR